LPDSALDAGSAARVTDKVPGAADSAFSCLPRTGQIRQTTGQPVSTGDRSDF
jgi:hypothetical protein